MYNLGAMYDNGFGTKRNSKLADQWFKNPVKLDMKKPVRCYKNNTLLDVCSCKRRGVIPDQYVKMNYYF
ncbi:MAG: hypothetical protein ACLR5N_09250 [Haemophilus parainfluenzae]